MKINPGPLHFCRNIFWSCGQKVIKDRGRFFVAAQSLASKGDLLAYDKIARIQFERLFKFLEGFLPLALPSVDVASHERNSRFVRERAPRSSQLLAGAVVVLIGPIQMLSEGEVCLSRIGVQTANGCFRQFKPRIGVIEPKEISPVMRCRKLTIGIRERRVAPNRLVEQLRGLEQIFFCPRAKRSAIDEVFGSQVQIVRNKIRSWGLLDGGFLCR